MINPDKTVALPPKGHASTAEEVSIIGNADVLIAKGGATIYWYLDRKIGLCAGARKGVVMDGGVDRLK